MKKKKGGAYVAEYSTRCWDCLPRPCGPPLIIKASLNTDSGDSQFLETVSIIAKAEDPGLAN